MAQFEFRIDGQGEPITLSGSNSRAKTVPLVHQKLSKAQQDGPWTILFCQFSESEL
jgi:hypothetical protein